MKLYMFVALLGIIYILVGCSTEHQHERNLLCEGDRYGLTHPQEVISEQCWSNVYIRGVQ